LSVSALFYASGAVVCLARVDYFLKLSSSRISTSLGTLVYALTAMGVPMIWFGWSKFSNEEFQITREAVIASMLVGLFSARRCFSFKDLCEWLQRVHCGTDDTIHLHWYLRQCWVF